MNALPNKTITQRWVEGRCMHAYNWLGAHTKPEGGARFSVWAPNAQRVSVVGDFNDWKVGKDKLCKDEKTGIWSDSVDRAQVGNFYKYAVTPKKTPDPFLKTDPYGRRFEPAPNSASVVCATKEFEWQDEQWLSKRQQNQSIDQPISIYEVHLGSWKRKEDGSYLSYQNLADQLIPYAKQMGFTHLELMPVTEYPYDPSWGYQPTGFFAPTCRYGSPQEFKQFINSCHKAGLGVIMDWVPAHFPKDEQGLRFFDGTPLYEPNHPLQREHKDWGTHAFDFSKPGVRNFLLSSAHWWCEQYHVDALRVDAVASMLYLDYSRAPGEWVPNKQGENKNIEAIDFLQKLNNGLHEAFPGVITFAEESTAWPAVTEKTEHGGLGFDYKWNMGWMNDTLQFMQMEESERRIHPKKITFPFYYAETEHFVLPLSHDEVVHLKKPLVEKAPGNKQHKFANLRMLFTYMIAHPGKKLLFMGGEFAQLREWSEARSLDWHLLLKEDHKGMQDMVKDLLHIYRKYPQLYHDSEPDKRFQWVKMSEDNSLLYSFFRVSNQRESALLFVFNFSGQSKNNQKLELQNYSLNSVIFNSNSSYYGGTDEGQVTSAPEGIKADVPPFSAFLMEVDKN